MIIIIKKRLIVFVLACVFATLVFTLSTATPQPAGELRILRTVPADKAEGVPLYPQIRILTDRPVDWAAIRLEEAGRGKLIPGKMQVSSQGILFLPEEVFLPETGYRVTVRAASGENVTPPLEFVFTTRSMDDQVWVDAKLGRIHTVTVYRGKLPLKHMLASGGKPGQDTPYGMYRTTDRGSSFWSERFGEGATYWVRLHGQYLVHSVPKDANWQTKEEEHAKLGLPASHGCVRLSDADARWFYQNVPPGATVIIHP